MRHLVAVNLDARDDAPEPRLKPSRFVVQAVPREVLFWDKADESVIYHESTSVERRAPMHDGQAERHRDTLCFGQQLLRDTPHHPPRRGREERVFAAVAAKAQFSKAQQPDSGA